MRLNIHKKLSKIFFASSLLLLMAAGGWLFYIHQSSKNPLPDSIKQQAGFKLVYPASNAQINPNSYNYQSNQKVLSFSANYSGSNIVFSEQQVPNSLGTDTQDYYPTLGLHPYAQFKTGLGVVALTKFWLSGSLKPAGESGIMVSSGTLLTAHTSKLLTNQQWKDLFDSLKITK
jgi:hypothetical protein